MYMVAVVLFAIAALGGLSMAVMHFRGTTPPKPLIAGLHGLFAAAGLTVLLVAMVSAGTAGGVGAAFGVFVLAALGGAVLLSFHLRGRALPSGLVVGHGVLAVIGFLILLVAAAVAGV